MRKMKLTSLSDLQRLLPGIERRLSSPQNEEKPSHNGKGKNVRVSLETEGRKGKSVTIVSGLQHNPSTMEEIARILKQHCGAGGTVKQGKIEIQGDQRGRVKEKLKEIGYVPNE
jgi:translation initiation factor 1